MALDYMTTTMIYWNVNRFINTQHYIGVVFLNGKYERKATNLNDILYKTHHILIYL